MSTYNSDDAASETLEPIKFRFTPPDSPIPQITRHSSSSPETLESRASNTSRESYQRRKRQKRKKRKRSHGQGDVVLFRAFAPDNPEIVTGTGDSSGESELEVPMSDTFQGPVAAPAMGNLPHTSLPGHALSSGVLGVASAVSSANLAIHSTALKRPHDEAAGLSVQTNSPAGPRRSDSGGFLEMDRRRLSYQKPINLTTSTSDPTGRTHDAVAVDGLLKLKGDSPRRASAAQDTIATSPILQQHVISHQHGTRGLVLPALTSDSPRGTDTHASAKQEISLPSLSKLIEETSTVAERPRTSSYSSVSSTIPGLSPPQGARTLPQPLQAAFQPMNPLARTSTGGSHESRSPGGPMGESPQELSNLVPDRRPYHQRRVPQRSVNAIPPMLPHSKSGSGSSRSLTSSAAHTNASMSTNTSSDAFSRSPETGPTPTETLPSSEDTPQSATGVASTYLHYPSVPIGGYRCQHEGCDAPPFSTQYLLNSHANVHSQERPHFCPVEGCLRGKGGRGFKRKNEMIRHGLVHQSPGYVCPWCPDREHRYPRPDNLQRHVRMHHDDKDKDDPKLLEVLSQRVVGGTSRGRKRRNA